ncbi:MAG: signal peptidase II [Dehalococcoidaceae bacterium]|nr:signal peptidase II [Dehalococcoidaceae bacterium]
MRLKADFRGLGLYLLVIALLVPLDQVTKFWIRTNLYLGESRPPEGFFKLTYIHNTGASFGMFQDGALFFTVFSTISFIVMIGIMLFGRKHIPFLNTWPGKLALGLVSAGTLGNLIDRFALGYVVDFIDFSFWPAFNLADSGIVVGAILLGWLILVNYKNYEADDGGRA